MLSATWIASPQFVSHRESQRYPRARRGGCHRDRRRGWGVYLWVREGVVLSDQQPGRLRQLSRHAGAVRRMAQGQSPGCRHLQRLSYAARADSQVRGEGRERFLALVLLHHRDLPRSHPGEGGEFAHCGGQLPTLPRGDRRPGRPCRLCVGVLGLHPLPSRRGASLAVTVDFDTPDPT